jgi:hypothetical protein
MTPISVQMMKSWDEALFGIGDEVRCAADEVRQIKDFLLAFGMRQDFGLRKVASHLQDIDNADTGMDRTVAVIEEERLLGKLMGNVSAQVLVGNEIDIAVGKGGDDIFRIGRGDANIGVCLDFGCGVDVADDSHVFVSLADFFGCRGS